MCVLNHPFVSLFLFSVSYTVCYEKVRCDLVSLIQNLRLNRIIVLDPTSERYETV